MSCSSTEEVIVAVGVDPLAELGSDDEGEEVIVHAPEADVETDPAVAAGLGDFPLDGMKRLSRDGAESTTSTESNWLPVPEAICVYHQRGSCLRLNCRYFHGTAEQLADLRGSGASHYRFDEKNKVELPKDGEELPETSASDEPTVAIRFSDAVTGKRKKPIVCLAFLSGSCRRSDCRFTHLPSNVRPLPATACAYFAVGTCKKGSCRYFHGTEAELERLKTQGATMYNPQTNEPYEKIPDFDEPPRPLSRASSAGSKSARSSTRSGTAPSKPAKANPPAAAVQYQAPQPQGAAPAHVAAAPMNGAQPQMVYAMTPQMMQQPMMMQPAGLPPAPPGMMYMPQPQMMYAGATPMMMVPAPAGQAAAGQPQMVPAQQVPMMYQQVPPPPFGSPPPPRQ